MLQAAVLGLAQFAPPRACILQEGHEVGNADNIHTCRPEIRIGGQGRQHHKAAITASHHGNTLRISNAAFAQVEYGMLQIGHGIHTQADIVQALVLVAVAGAAAHIGDEDAIAARNKILNDRIEDGARLAFWTSMHENNDGKPARLLAAWKIHESWYLASIKGWIAHHRRFHEAMTRNAAERAARRPPERPLLYVPHPHVRSVTGAIQREGQALAIL